MNTTNARDRMEPPIVQAAHVFDEDTNRLSYEYNGRTVMAVHLPRNVKAYYRRLSDGNLQTRPFVQQLYLAFESLQTVRVRFELSEDAMNMRPRRASDGEAILGQVGRPTLYGANGLYDVLQDLLIDWHGAKWKWACDRIGRTEQGNSVAEIDVEVGKTPWIINFRMQYYRKHLGFSYHKPWEWRPNLKAVAGWCSWEAYRWDVREEHVAEAARFVGEHFKPYGLEYVQLDDGFQQKLIPPTRDGSVAESWLMTNEKFPAGHAGLVSGIAAHGLQPGIWTNAVVTNGEAARSICLTDAAGEPVHRKWIQYVLDCTPETLARHVAPYYRGLREAGYTYFKTDAIRHLIYEGLREAVKDGLLSNDEASEKFRAFLVCAKEHIGDAYLLSCWGVFEEVVGLADACRVATDSNATWPAIRMQLVESARWFHTQRILFVNDPDHVCVRAPLEWARSAISMVALTGGLLMVSDKPANYDAERISMIQRNLPPLTTVTAETGALDISYPAFAWTHVQGYSIDLDKATDSPNGGAGQQTPELSSGDKHPFTSLWAIHLQNEFRTWCVAARFATEALPKSNLETAALGLDPEREYAVFDYWEQRYLGRHRGTIPGRALETGACQLLGVSPVTAHPSLLASSRHVSMDAVSVKDERWDGQTRTLTMKLAGVPATTEDYWIYLPEGFRIAELALRGGTGTFKVEGEAAKIQVSFEEEEALVSVRFA